MAGDVVQRAVEIGGGTFDADAVLVWLANIVRSLRNSDSAECGKAGTFHSTEESGTVEINPATRIPVSGYSRKALSFTASGPLTAIVQESALTDQHLAALAEDDPIGTAFAHALATELVLSRRAAIGNFGVWTIGQKPTMERFVRFRPRPAINRML